MTSTERKWSEPSTPGDGISKFPDYDAPLTSAREHETIHEEGPSQAQSAYALPNGQWNPGQNGSTQHDRWVPKREQSQRRTNGYAYGSKTHTRQKSLSDAIRTINARRGSVSQNAQEIADALKAPVSYRLVVSTNALARDFRLIRLPRHCVSYGI
jgi:solute carrier family 35, member E1